MRRVLVATMLGLWALAAQAAVGGYGVAVGPVEGTDYLVEQPEAQWRAARWPVVVALAPAPAQVKATFERFRPLTRERGALLVALAGGDELRMQTVLNTVAGQQPVLRDQVFLVASEQLGSWTWQQLLGHPGLYAGFVTIDGQVPAVLEPVPGQQPTTAGKACLLASTPDKLDSSRRLQQSLQRWGLTCAVKSFGPEELASTTGGALTALLPPQPRRTDVTDPVTTARLKAAPGWHFVRRDGFVAIARPDDPTDNVVAEIITGKLGKRSFEGYVESCLQALRQRGISLRDNLRLTPANAASPVHSFAAVDSRGPDLRGVAWLLVGSGDRMVSIRAVGPPEVVTARSDELKAMALGVVFD